MPYPHALSATYRLQLTPDFNFAAARAVLPYLAELGASHVYASPILAARSGSSHGYDGVNPGRVSPALGGRDGFSALTDRAEALGLGWIQDIVPNHMAYSPENELLMDVFENGRQSAYYQFFDIDWRHFEPALTGRVLAPFLGRRLGRALEKGDIRLDWTGERFVVRYFDWTFPIALPSYPDLLETALPGDNADTAPAARILAETAGAIFAHLNDAAPAAEGRAAMKAALAGLSKRPEALDRVGAIVALYNGETAEAQGGIPLRLDRLLTEQVFRLAFWKVAGREINYRRFFHINDLICVRVGDPSVFEQTHAVISALIRERRIQGLRVDHVDGLADPGAYLRKLRTRFPETLLLVEKILEADEPLPPEWPVEGTTGYDFMNHVNGLFVPPALRERFDAIYADVLGAGPGQYPDPDPAIGMPLLADGSPCLPDLRYRHKQRVLEVHMGGDLNNAARRLKEMARRHPMGRDLAFADLRDALGAVASCFPVYRTYIDESPVGEADARRIETAVAAAMDRAPELADECDFIRRALLGGPDFSDPEIADRRRRLADGFQQLTAPLAAKGLEDTTLYAYNRLISLNEVGGDPARFGIDPARFHAFCQDRARTSPKTLNATATHDTKRGEDARARINVLTEMATDWAGRVRRWSEINARHKREVNHRPAPDGNTEYLLYQTLIGAFYAGAAEDADFHRRIGEFLIKAQREAKMHTSWIAPDADYEDACVAFAEAILDPSPDNTFLADFHPFFERVAHFGMINSLAQTLIKIAAPGIADFYQGCELWDLSLVDPDNRRPVDYAARAEMLGDIRERMETDPHGLMNDLLAEWSDGRIKLFLIHRTLMARRRNPALFSEGAYLPAELEGAAADHVMAFFRHNGPDWCLAIAPRLALGLNPLGGLPMGPAIWDDTRLRIPDNAPTQWRDAISGQDLAAADGFIGLGEALTRFPVGLLMSS